MDRRVGRSSSRARASASGPQGYQSTGLWACWRRYGLVSPARRFSGIGSMVRTTLVARLRLRSADALYDPRTRGRARRPPRAVLFGGEGGPRLWGGGAPAAGVAATAPESERRLVSVLFADLV